MKKITFLIVFINLFFTLFLIYFIRSIILTNFIQSVHAALAPARVSGYVYPPSCPRTTNPKVMTIYNFVGQTLNVYMSNKLAASTTIIRKDSKDYFSVSIPMTMTQDLATFVIRNSPWAGILIHPGDNITANLCGTMPLIPIKK
jgi:hypothetical protein